MEQDRVAAEAITGVARSADGSVTVEVGIGGGLRSVRLSREALRRGGAELARTVLDVAQAATARANERAHHAFGRALGPAATDALTSLGVPPPSSSADDLDDEDLSQESPLGRRR